jgi:hypothetical protein
VTPLVKQLVELFFVRKSMNRRRVPMFIPGYDKSYALVSDDNALRAVVFVHGFGGSPTGTWRDFHGLIE